MSKDEDKAPTPIEMLSQHLAEVKRLQPESTPNAKLPGDAARSAIDFASATAVGTVLGYGLDVWQNTLPWGVVVGLLIGTGAGVKLMLQHEARARAESEADINDTL